MVKKKKPASKLCMVQQKCYRDIEYCFKCIKIFQDYIDEYNNKYSNDNYSHVRLAGMVIHAYESNIAGLSDILSSIDSTFKKLILSKGRVGQKFEMN